MRTEYSCFSYCCSKTPDRSSLERKGLFWLLVLEGFQSTRVGRNGRDFIVNQETESTGRAGGKARSGGNLTFKGPPLEMDLRPPDRP